MYLPGRLYSFPFQIISLRLRLLSHEETFSRGTEELPEQVILLSSPSVRRPYRLYTTDLSETIPVIVSAEVLVSALGRFTPLVDLGPRGSYYFTEAEVPRVSDRFELYLF